MVCVDEESGPGGQAQGNGHRVVKCVCGGQCVTADRRSLFRGCDDRDELCGGREGSEEECAG